MVTGKLSRQAGLPERLSGDAGIRAVIGRTIAMGGPVLGLVLLVAYLSLVSPHFLSQSNLVNIAKQSAVNAIIATGQTLVILAGGIDLSVGAVMALSASVAAVSMTYHGINVWVGMMLGLVMGALAGLVNGLIITKGKVPDFIATLGLLSMARGLALIITGGLPVPSHLAAHKLKAYLPPQLIWLGGGHVLGIPTAAVVALMVVLIGFVITRFTRMGRSLYAIGGSKEAARVSGINIDLSKVAVYTVMGVMAAVAGIVMTGRLNSANALMGEGAELQSIAAVVIGGSNLYGGEGSVGGTLVGALILGVLANGLNLLNVSAFWQRVIMGAVVVSVVILDQWRRRRFVVSR